MSKQRIYRVIFHNRGKIYEIYAREVGHDDLLGFVGVGKLILRPRSGVVVDPSEERIESEFEGVQRFYVPMHSIVRIDEVEKRGACKISEVEGGKVAQFPVPFYTPGGGSSSS